ncbi:MAG: metallophosphoesterase [Clostridium sp.]|nr:metallophosphoesterase [Clostridium sp.]MDY3827636.1 metallophosphoesterase [Clostridium sp.]
MWIFIMLALLAIFIYGVVRLFPLDLTDEEKKLKDKKVTIYLLCNLLLMANMFGVMINFKKISNDTLAKVLLFFSSIYFIIIIYGAVVVLFRDIILFIIKRTRFKRAYKILKSKKFIRGLLVVLLVMAIGGYIAESFIVVKEYNVDINKKADKSEYTLVVLSDSHIGAGNTKEDFDEVVNMVNDINPDFIFLAGDMIDENTSDLNVEYFVNSIKKMKSNYGIFSVYGNHERHSQDKLFEMFKDTGVSILQDDAVTIQGINIIGRKDYYSEGASITDVIDKYNVDTSKPTIVLEHEPKQYDILKKCGIDLVLSGHTHGHQLPGAYPFLALANDMVYGYDKFDNMNAIVSAGTGNWGIRFTTPGNNEVVKITLNLEAL